MQLYCTKYGGHGIKLSSLTGLRIAIQQALDEVLEYDRTHRPKNTTKNYEPKQREWRVSAGPSALRP
jgi:hypothetical protein